MRTKRSLLLFAGLALGMLVTGCGASSAYMREAAVRSPLRPPKGQSMVVFVRPSSFAFAMKFAIVNHAGQFMGESLASTHFPVVLAPGRHVFIVWAENTAALQADLAPDRTYYVEVAPKMGAFSARCHLLAVTPRHPSWGKVEGWLAESRRLEPDLAAGQANISSRHEDTAERVRRGLEHLANYDPEERAERTIMAQDGT